MATSGPAADPAPDPLTLPQVQSEIRRLMWTKGDLQVIPYGMLWGNAVYATERMNPTSMSYALFVESASTQGEDEATVDGRTTRLGVDVLGPRVAWLGNAQLGGKVEIDFQGNINTVENKGGLLLRHAYAEIKSEDYRVLAGQTWDVISPLNPGTLLYTVGWDAGNIGYRRGQFRFERYLAFSDAALLTVQSSIDQDIFSDTAIVPVTGQVVRPEPGPWPLVEGRVAITLGERKGPDALPITFGVSSHIGQQEFDVLKGATVLSPSQRRSTWSLNADLRIPVTTRFGYQMEFFTGENLGTFLGGIGQGIEPTTLEGIHSTGGWCEVWYDWTPCFHSHFGYSLDDPDNRELVTKGDRTYNQFFYGNFIYDITRQFMVGVEISSWKTLFVGQEPGEAIRSEFVMRYAF
jgi:hypothetical protein